MNKRILIPIMFLLAVAVVCCEDILETDVSGDVVSLRLPADSISQRDSVAVLFWWNELDGATQYELLVVSPDNVNPTMLVLDTLITKTQFSASLQAGQYQWCVRGVNSGYKTEFTCRTITITETDPLPPEAVVALRLPAGGVTLESGRKVTFSWDAYAGAEHYTILIESPTHASPAFLEVDTTTANTQYARTLEPGEYEWCVMATGDSGETTYACRKITITDGTD